MTDMDGLAAIKTAIETTGLLAEIDWGIYRSGPDPTSLGTPFCWVRPTKWKVLPFEGDDTEPIRERQVDFEIEIQTRNGEGADPSDIATAIEKAVHGAKLLTSTSCVCDSGKYMKFGGNVHPQHRLTVTGHFTYEL